jgi:hypothetical protein
MKNDTKRPTSRVTPFNLELAQVAGAWVLTHWVGSGVALRLKLIQKYGTDDYSDEQEVTAEVRLGRYFPFDPIHSFSISRENIFGGSSDCDYGSSDGEACRRRIWSCLPTMFAEDFKAMLLAWGALGDIVRFGCTDRPRYDASTSDSRDLYELALEDPRVAG